MSSSSALLLSSIVLAILQAFWEGGGGVRFVFDLIRFCFEKTRLFLESRLPSLPISASATSMFFKYEVNAALLILTFCFAC